MSLRRLLLPLLLAASWSARATNPNWPNTTATRAQLALPANWPDDPSYGYLAPGTCPSGPMAGQTVMRPQGGQWNLWGFYPPDTTDPCAQTSVVPYTLNETLLASERAAMNGSGLSADVAWTMTIGDPRVLLAVHDSGAEWGNTDLVNKWYLNQGELPLPEMADGTACAAYDCNGDGVFNVLDYTSGSGHDQPVIGIVTDPRITGYMCAGNTTCHGDTNGNGLLDPEDLIRIFSDGKDDDNNGFVDDICGWDFYWNTNDPVDDVNYGHGTGEASDMAAEGNNGIDGIGICPDCRVMPVRVGDSYIADADHFAEGVFFSLSHGANVISEALGGLDNTPLMQAAINAAYAQGAIVVASAADEDSLHHNYPGNAEHTLLVHAVTHDASDENATSFIRYNNCTNAGGHLVLSTPGESCSSEATGKTSGAAGLIYSAMLKYHPSPAPPLTAAEVMQLIWMTSEDINVPGSATNPALYPSGPGWDTYFGYGRLDAGAAVTAVMNGQIPPEVDITSPLWFATVDSTQTPMLTVAGHVSAARASSYDFTVLVAAGLDPVMSPFQTAGSMTGLTAASDGTLATFDLTGLIANPEATSMDPNVNAATVVVQATAHYGGSIGDVQGLFRKSFFVHRDPDLFAGFPLNVGASGESSPHLVDLNGSGHDTIVVATADGHVHTFQPDGSELPGWPVKVDPLADVAADSTFPVFGSGGTAYGTPQAITATVAIGSLHGDGTLQIVASTLDGQVYAWNVDGSLVGGFPVKADPTHYLTGTSDTTLADGTQVLYVLGRGFFASPALADLGGTGKLEIIQPGEDGWLYAWDGDGQPWPGFPVQVYDPNGGDDGSTHEIIHSKLMATPAIGDLNGDGQLEIVISSNENYGTTSTRAYAVWPDGNTHAGGPYLPGWPISPIAISNDSLPDIATGNPNASAIADINGDGKDEIEVGPPTASPAFYDGAGNEIGIGDEVMTGSMATTTDWPYAIAVNGGAFGDVDGDGQLDFVDGTIGAGYASAGLSGATRATPSHAVTAWSVGTAAANSGLEMFVAEPLSGFPALTSDFQFFMNYAIADIDGDGKNEIISGTGVYLVTAFRADGSQPAGWPKNTGGWVASTPALGDIDGDGLIDVVTTTRDGWLWAWHGQGLASQKIEWEGYHHDPRNTGNYGVALESRHGPIAATTTKGGCHCGDAGAESSIAMLGVFLAAGRRRRGWLRTIPLRMHDPTQDVATSVVVRVSAHHPTMRERRGAPTAPVRGWMV